MGIDTGKVKVTGIVNKTFHVEERQECHDAMKNKSVIKAALVFDYHRYSKSHISAFTAMCSEISGLGLENSSKRS
ncbi:hypothetical protein EIK77_003297 [Talaromyces pinophilus]|nr:hypothetical protein EIK77_003297 [Talaromyces pinophilus]